MYCGGWFNKKKPVIGVLIVEIIAQGYKQN